MRKILPIGPMPEIVTVGDMIKLAYDLGFTLKSSKDAELLDAEEFLSNFTPSGYWLGWSDEGKYGVWPDGDLTD